MNGVKALDKTLSVTKKLMNEIPQRILDKPLTSLTASDCARMARETLKSKDAFVRQIAMAQGITQEACKNGKTYAAAANEKVKKASLSIVEKMFTKKGQLTKGGKRILEQALSLIGLNPNATNRQVLKQAEKILANK